MKKSSLFTFKSFGLALALFSLSVGCKKDAGVAEQQGNNTLNPTLSVAAVQPAVATGARESKNTADDAFDREIDQVIHQGFMEMERMPMTGDPDIDFAHMMIKHHEAGIKMADVELRYGHEAKAKELARKTKKGNEESKQRLQAFLNSHKKVEKISEGEQKHFKADMDEAMKKMMFGMQAAPDTDDPDIDFSELIIRHHQGALEMAGIELKFGDDEPVLKEAKMMIEEQTMEIIEYSMFINKHSAPVKSGGGQHH